MQIANLETKTSLIQRLKKIEGQVRGIEGMLTEERDLPRDHAAIDRRSLGSAVSQPTLPAGLC